MWYLSTNATRALIDKKTSLLPLHDQFTKVLAFQNKSETCALVNTFN